jgi:hypothetical protein
VRLTELDPKLVGSLEDGVVTFDCPFPACQAKGPHRVRVPVSSAPFHKRDPRPGEHGSKNDGKVRVWQASGSFPDSLTLVPSINIVDDDDKTICWHGHITNGEAR